MASNSGWDKSSPSGQSAAADGDNAIRSFKSHMQAWWEQEHYATDGSASSAGIAKHGAGRAFVGTTSQLSNPNADNDGRLFHATDNAGLYVANASTSSWTNLTNNIALGSQQTWTALQELSSGAEASNLSLTGLFSGWTSYSTFTNLASIGTNTVRQWVATDISATNVEEGDYTVMRMSDPDPFFILTADARAGSIQLNVANVGNSVENPSAQTYTVFIYKAGHLQ